MLFIQSNVFKNLVILLALAVSGVACDGPVGPQGDRGAQGSAGQDGVDGRDGRDGQDGRDGEDGERGPRGPQGPAGEDGNANVMYSDWINIDWNRTDGEVFKQMLIEIELSEGFFDEGGTTLMFLKDFDPDIGFSVVPLPRTVSNDLVSYAYVNAPGFAVGFIVQAESIDGDTPVNTDLEGLEVRYIIIEGTTLVGGLRAGLRAELDLDDYQVVKTYYGIPDEGAGHVPLSH